MSGTHAHTVAYVAPTQYADQTPPASQVGILAWFRENFFSSWWNSLLTVLSIALLAAVLPGLVDWAIIKAVWQADSLRECRDLIQERFGPGATGACWAVINERFSQIVYGFYPTELRWRPNVTAILLVVALAPILFRTLKPLAWAMAAILAGKVLWALYGLVDGSASVSVLWSPSSIVAATVGILALSFAAEEHRKRWLIVTAVFPVLAYLLLWGGTFWWIPLAVGVVALTILSFRVLRTFFEKVEPQILSALPAAFRWTGAGPLAVPLAAVLTAAIAFLLAGTVLPAATEALQSAVPFGFEPVESSKFGGFLLTMVIGVTGISASLPIGVVLALGRQSNLPVVKTVCVLFIEFIRGVPLITLLFVASTLLNYFLPPGTSFDLILRVLIMVTLFASAYMAEVVRGGLASLPRGQYEAAQSMGLTYWQGMRLIILPQALKVSIPGIVNTFIGLFKDTTLVAVIGLLDPLGLTNPIRSDAAWNGIVWELYGFIALVFFVFCWGMSQYSQWLEGRLAAGDNR
jgi:general L-amino acid transport system permease protein